MGSAAWASPLNPSARQNISTVRNFMAMSPE
jgi:hypothetical protein